MTFVSFKLTELTFGTNDFMLQLYKRPPFQLVLEEHVESPHSFRLIIKSYYVN